MIPRRFKRHLAESAARGEGLLVALDFDGTLARLRRHREDVELPERRRRLLERIARLPGVRLMIVSGRPIKDLKRLCAGTGAALSGDHGMELIGLGKPWLHPRRAALTRKIPRLLAEIRPWTAGLPGVELEPKAGSVSVHWRNSPVARRHPEKLKKVLEDLLPKGWRVVPGKCVWDIRPSIAWGKGDAILYALGRLGRGWRALFAGDDQTDEEAFLRLGARAWLIKVGSGHSVSFWRVSGIERVDALLRSIIRARASARIS